MTLLSINQKSLTPLYTQISDQIRNMIGRGDLKAGDALPPIRQIASQLGIAVNTVARAYRDLEGEGILESNGRRGSFVRADYVSQLSGNLFREPVQQYLRAGLSNDDIARIFSRALEILSQEEKT